MDDTNSRKYGMIGMWTYSDELETLEDSDDSFIIWSLCTYFLVFAKTGPRISIGKNENQFLFVHVNKKK